MGCMGCIDAVPVAATLGMGADVSMQPWSWMPPDWKLPGSCPETSGRALDQQACMLTQSRLICQLVLSLRTRSWMGTAIAPYDTTTTIWEPRDCLSSCRPHSRSPCRSSATSMLTISMLLSDSSGDSEQRVNWFQRDGERRTTRFLWKTAALKKAQSYTCMIITSDRH